MATCDSTTSSPLQVAKVGVDDRSQRAGRAAPSIMDAAPSIMEAAYEAAKEGDLRGVEVALATGADVNQKHHGDTMLAIAAYSGHHEVVRFLLEHGADPDIGRGDDDSYKILHSASDAQMIDLLVAHGANVELREIYGRTALMVHAVQFHEVRVDEVRALLRHGASFNARDINDRTALDLARSMSQTNSQMIGATSIRDLRRERGQLIIDLLEAVEAAGSWKRYVREPIVQLLSLRFLCLAGRATPMISQDRPWWAQWTAPPKLVRLFGAPPVPNAAKARRAASGTPLPNEVFVHILTFWNPRT